MLRLTEQQFQALAMMALLRQLRLFLIERSGDTAVQALLARAETCLEFWRPLYDQRCTDYDQALRLTVALVARSRGEESRAWLDDIDAAPDPEDAAKLKLETAGVLRYSEFDIL